VRSVLCNLPRDLSETYSRIIDRTYNSPGGDAKLEMMRKVFRWVSGAKRSLDLAELEEAVGLDPSDKSFPVDRIARHEGKRLISACGNLVIYDEEDGSVGFAHHTVLQYLVTRSPRQHPSLLATDLRPTVVDTYIGEVCLAYLSYSDFETQLDKLPEHAELQHETAEALLWWNVPFASTIRQAVAWTRPRERRSQWRPIPLPVYIKPSKTWTRKFVLLEYIIAYWAFHTATWTKDSPTWPTFRHIALERELLFEVRPWNESQHQAKVDEVLEALQKHSGTLFDRGRRDDNVRIMQIYAWAMGNGAASLFTLLRPDHLTPYLCLVLAAILPGKAGSKVTLTQAFASLINTLLRKPHHPRALQLGFWNGALIYWLATQLELDFRPVMDWYYKEYGRWAKPDVLSFGVFSQDAISIAVEQGDTPAFIRLTNYHINAYQDLLAMINFLKLNNQLHHKMVLHLLSIELTNKAFFSHLGRELISAFQSLLPAIYEALEIDRDSLRSVSAAIGPLLLIAVLTNDRTGHPILIFIALRKYVNVLLRVKGLFQDVVSDKDKTTERLRLLLQGHEHRLCESLLAHIDLARDVLPTGLASGVSCTCHLDVLSALFFYNNTLWLNNHELQELIMEILSSYEASRRCAQYEHSAPGNALTQEFISWSVTAPTAVWERVLRLNLIKHDVESLEEEAEENILYFSPRRGTRVLQLSQRISHNHPVDLGSNTETDSVLPSPGLLSPN
jgi:hypothetical protein